MPSTVGILQLCQSIISGDRLLLDRVNCSVHSTSQSALGVQGGCRCWLQLMCCASLLHHVQVFWMEIWSLGFKAEGLFWVKGRVPRTECRVVNRSFELWYLAFGFQPIFPKGVGDERVVTMFWVGHILWSIYKMSKIYGWEDLLY